MLNIITPYLKNTPKFPSNDDEQLLIIELKKNNFSFARCSNDHVNESFIVKYYMALDGTSIRDTLIYCNHSSGMRKFNPAIEKQILFCLSGLGPFISFVVYTKVNRPKEFETDRDYAFCFNKEEESKLKVIVLEVCKTMNLIYVPYKWADDTPLNEEDYSSSGIILDSSEPTVKNVLFSEYDF